MAPKRRQAFVYQFTPTNLPWTSSKCVNIIVSLPSFTMNILHLPLGPQWNPLIYKAIYRVSQIPGESVTSAVVTLVRQFLREDVLFLFKFMYIEYKIYIYIHFIEYVYSCIWTYIIYTSSHHLIIFCWLICLEVKFRTLGPFAFFETPVSFNGWRRWNTVVNGMLANQLMFGDVLCVHQQYMIPHFGIGKALHCGTWHPRIKRKTKLRIQSPLQRRCHRTFQNRPTRGTIPFVHWKKKRTQKHPVTSPWEVHFKSLKILEKLLVWYISKKYFKKKLRITWNQSNEFSAVGLGGANARLLTNIKTECPLFQMYIPKQL